MTHQPIAHLPIKVFMIIILFTYCIIITKCGCSSFTITKVVMDRLQTSGELQDKTSFIDPSTGVGLL
jgi:hypothetical protein